MHLRRTCQSSCKHQTWQSAPDSTLAIPYEWGQRYGLFRLATRVRTPGKTIQPPLKHNILFGASPKRSQLGLGPLNK